MKHLCKILAAGLSLTAFVQTAQAEETSGCEVVVVEVIKAADGSGEMHIQSFRGAEDFIASARDDSPDHITQINGNKISGLLCTRNDIIPAAADYPLLATGVPLSLSQDFDSGDTDSLIVKWIEGTFKYKYAGYPLSDEAQILLKARLAAFSERGLNDWAIETEARNALAKDLERGDANIINTASASAADALSLDEIAVTTADQILSGEIAATEATRLNSVTEN